MTIWICCISGVYILGYLAVYDADASTSSSPTPRVIPALYNLCRRAARVGENGDKASTTTYRSSKYQALTYFVATPPDRGWQRKALCLPGGLFALCISPARAATSSVPTTASDRSVYNNYRTHGTRLQQDSGIMDKNTLQQRSRKCTK